MNSCEFCIQIDSEWICQDFPPETYFHVQVLLAGFSETGAFTVHVPLKDNKSCNGECLEPEFQPEQRSKQLQLNFEVVDNCGVALNDHVVAMLQADLVPLACKSIRLRTM